MSAISIIIATKDRAAYLHQALSSLVVQEGHPGFEVIVVDNASSDDTANVIRAASEEVPFPLRYAYEPVPNRGKARNRGVARAKSELILFVDDDVWLPPNFVRAHVDAHLDGNPAAVSGPIINVPSYAERPRPTPFHFSNAFFCTCNVSLPKARFDAAGGFDEDFELYGWEDTELGLRLREGGLARGFAWDAYLFHIKPPAEATLESAMRKTIEKAQMAARLIRKHPSRRAKLAAGAYGLNYLRARAFAPAWLQPLYAGLLTQRLVPRALAGFVRTQLLDGIYVRELSEARWREQSRPAH